MCFQLVPVCLCTLQAASTATALPCSYQTAVQEYQDMNKTDAKATTTKPNCSRPLKKMPDYPKKNMPEG